MLLFNPIKTDFHAGHDEFKYISCYYLTGVCSGKQQYYGIQIHLMLLFNSLPKGAVQGADRIQIHLMLLFNMLVKRKKEYKNNSNTSHVII